MRIERKQRVFNTVGALLKTKPNFQLCITNCHEVEHVLPAENANFQMNILSYLLGEVLKLNFLLATRFFPFFLVPLTERPKIYIYQPQQFETNTSFKILILPQAIQAISVLQIERKAIS